MTAHKFPLSQKYRDFIRSIQGVTAEFLEGTTASGKTTVGAGVKFMYMVSASPKRLHIIAAKTTGIAEKNIIQQENGILDLHRNAVYCGNGDRNNKLPHIKFEGKLIYVLGYDNKDKWENVLGSQFGCVYIDEINTADIDFVREISTRNDYLLATLNPDDPSLPVYREFVNRSRPCARYAAQEQAWRKRLNSLVKENSDVLRMDYRRLKVYDAPVPPAGKTAAVPPAPKPKAAKAKVHTEGGSAGHAVEVTPPAPKDNGSTGKTYSPEEVKHLKGNYSIAFDKVSGTKEITPQLAREFSDEYDRFTQKFGKTPSVRSVLIEPYKSNGIWGTYNDNNGTISISGAGGKDGKNTISKVAAEMKKTGKWSSSSPYHAFRHELGHALQKHLKDTVPDYEERLKKVRDIRDAFFESLTGLDEDAIMKLKKEALSIYGLVDDESLDEFISECVAEYCSKKPRKMSRDVVAALLHKGGNENAD